MRLTRRATLIGAASALAGCGFHPLYAPTERGGYVGSELQAIYVGVMGERPGQLLRQALQRRFEGSGGGVAKKYELTGGLGIAGEGIAIQQDTSSTRVRLIGTATWNLHELNLQSTPLTSGTTRAVDGYNINNQQYFAADMEASAAYQRIAETCADQITLEVASFLKKRLAAQA